MKKYSILAVKMFCACVVLLLISCNDFLEFEPINTPIRQTFWQDEADANSAVVGAYNELRKQLKCSRDFITYGDWPTQLFNKTEHEHRGNFSALGNNDLTDWSKFYKIILAANVANEQIQKMPVNKFAGGEAKRASYIGEVLFIRAYTYFYMVRIWKEVPLVIKAIEDVSDAEYAEPLASEDDILEQCIKDLKLAYDYLSWDLTQGKRTRANRSSINALLAHIYMWRTRANKNENEIDKNDFTRAIDCIDEIERYSGASLVSAANYHDIWKGNSKESLFEFTFKYEYGEAFGKNAGLADRYMGDPYIPTMIGKKVSYPFMKYFLNLYKKPNDDLRIKYLFQNFPDPNYCFTTKYNNIRFLNPEKTDWVTEDAVVIWRLADMYLLKAEAYCKKEDYSQARIYLNKVRTRAGIGDYVGVDATLYEEIADERSRELFLEGHRLYDFVRTGFYYVKCEPGRYSKERYDQEGYLWPVNYRLFDVENPYIRQTPYWQDKM